MKRTEQPLSELAKAMTAVPQILLNVKVSKKPNLDSIPDLQQAISESERRFNGSGRILVRYSGTEPLLRIMVEGERDSLIREEADRLARIVTAHLS
jgi:phosphoglucosamine mutase